MAADAPCAAGASCAAEEPLAVIPNIGDLGDAARTQARDMQDCTVAAELRYADRLSQANI